jgi:phosphoglycolate phosphatase-like HAD superfamily hydrolase
VALARAAERFGRAFVPEETVVIGDTPADIRCARASGMRVLAVATGRHTVGELEANRPDAVLEDLTDTDRIVAFFLGEPADG